MNTKIVSVSVNPASITTDMYGGESKEYNGVKVTIDDYRSESWQVTSVPNDLVPMVFFGKSTTVSEGLVVGETYSIVITSDGGWGEIAWRSESFMYGEQPATTIAVSPTVPATTAICGNSIVELPETCDDGNLVALDGCDSACQVETATTTAAPVTAACGNGVLEAANFEECDDGNLLDGDGCSSTCTVEVTTVAPTVPITTLAPLALCGNFIVEVGEQCDDGNIISGDRCDNLCQIELFCGDGKKAAGEKCDDGNANNADGCSSTCQIETGFACGKAYPSVCNLIVCGDGQKQGSEQCDDGNLVDGDGCSSKCATEPICGDGKINAAGEQCDDENTKNGDGCSSTCQIEISDIGGSCNSAADCVPTAWGCYAGFCSKGLTGSKCEKDTECENMCDPLTNVCT